MNYEQMLNMALHEEERVSWDLRITRVPSGWLYERYSHDKEDEQGYKEPLWHPPIFVKETNND